MFAGQTEHVHLSFICGLPFYTKSTCMYVYIGTSYTALKHQIDLHEFRFIAISALPYSPGIQATG